MNKAQSKAAAIKTVTLIGAFFDALLSLLKVSAGLVFQSTALVADGLHSLSDLVTDGLVLFINRFAHQPPDKDHPYGHARFETLGTVLMGISLVLVALGMGYEVLTRFFIEQRLAVLGWPALAVALLSMAVKEGLYQYTQAVAKRVKSSLLQANAWHSRSDALSSLVVFIGLGGAMLGLTWLEPLAALVIVAMIGKMGFGLLYDAAQELVDRGLSSDIQQHMLQTIKQVPGVLDAHALRTRLAGGSQIHMDVHIQVGSHLTVSEGHHIGDLVVVKMREQFDDLHDIVVHIDAEKDLHKAKQLAPVRAEVLPLFSSHLGLPAPVHANLHYLQKGLEVELYLPMSEQSQHQQRCQQADSLCASLPWLARIHLLYQTSEAPGTTESTKTTEPEPTDK